MLFLRRIIGEELVLIDQGEETHIKVTDIEVEDFLVTVEITHFRKPVTLYKGLQVDLCHGRAKLVLSDILTFKEYPTSANLGIGAPHDIVVKRGEKLAGITREARRQMRSTADEQ